MKIRKAKPEDLDALNELAYKFLAYESDNHDSSYDPDYARTDASALYVKNKIKSLDSLFLVAIENNEIVGFLAGTLHKRPKARKTVRPASLDELYVEEKFRNQGVGKEMISRFQDWAKKQGANKLKVGTFHKNERALHVYKDLGFKDHIIKLEKDI